MGADLRPGGGGGLDDGIAMILFPNTFIVHNQKSTGGGAIRQTWCERGDMAPQTSHSYATTC